MSSFRSERSVDNDKKDHLWITTVDMVHMSNHDNSAVQSCLYQASEKQNQKVDAMWNHDFVDVSCTLIPNKYTISDIGK